MTENGSAAETAVADPSSIVDVRDLRKTYRQGNVFSRKGDVDALRGVSLTAKAGEVFGLLGPNGAGKTTLIKTLLGVVKATGGTATLFGQSVGSAAARRRVGYLPESLRVDRHHTARSALQYYGRLSEMSAPDIQRRSDELLRIVGLEGRDRESVRRFSKGMYQRLGLAQALMHDPDLLVLDEPTDGLDPVGRNEVRRVIDRLRNLGKTIFLNSHILQEVELVCTRVAIMAGGQVLAIGPLDQLQTTAAGQSKGGNETPVQVAATVFRVKQNNPVENTADQLIGCFNFADESRLDTKPLEGHDGVFQVLVAGADASITSADSVNQAELDSAVDSLRSAGWSLVGLKTTKPTLEDTFMRLVGQTETEVQR